MKRRGRVPTNAIITSKEDLEVRIPYLVLIFNLLTNFYIFLQVLRTSSGNKSSIEVTQSVSQGNPQFALPISEVKQSNASFILKPSRLILPNAQQIMVTSNQPIQIAPTMAQEISNEDLTPDLTSHEQSLGAGPSKVCHFSMGFQINEPFRYVVTELSNCSAI